MKNYLDYLEKRRSYYELDNQVKVDNKEIEALIGKVLVATPSAFNMQSAKLLLLFDEKHVEFWNKVNATFDNSINKTKFKGFVEAKGTVLYFIDRNIVGKMQDRFPNYKQSFDIWANHENAIVQSNIWVALRGANIGASLQHYNPVIDKWVTEEYGLDKNFELLAQMPFGNIISEPEPKEKFPASERIKIIE
ncbi:MAG: nitroreductase [Ruminococcaceae bacterium]|nr:nitroreductase [Oscillospiraceae bacterium]